MALKKITDGKSRITVFFFILILNTYFILDYCGGPRWNQCPGEGLCVSTKGYKAQCTCIGAKLQETGPWMSFAKSCGWFSFHFIEFFFLFVAHIYSFLKILAKCDDSLLSLLLCGRIFRLLTI